MPASQALDMPSFRGDDGALYVWDSASKTYVRHEEPFAKQDRGHASGGDNALFDPATQTEKAKNPLQEGFMAAAYDDGLCPKCGEPLLLNGQCEHCGESNPFREFPVQQHNPGPFPDRVPKPNQMRTDPTFPSMISRTAADEWDNAFAGPELAEIGKFVVDQSDHLHYEPGTHADHKRLIARDQITQPGALGSVYSNGTADIQRIYPGYSPHLPEIEEQLGEAFGEGIKIEHVFGQSGTSPQIFAPTEITSGTNLGGHANGIAWVKERSNGVAMRPGMIFVAEHLQPEDQVLYSTAGGIVCATGGTSSHAAIVAEQSGIPTVVGIGADYNKIETGNLISIDERGVGVHPDATSYQNFQEEQTRQHQMEPLLTAPNGPQQGLHEYMRRRLTPSMSHKEFAHFDEEMAFAATQPTLDSCPECSSPMTDMGNEKICHTCGARQPIMHTTIGGIRGAGFLAPLLEVGAGGAEAGGAAGAAGAGAEAGGGMGGIGAAMKGALAGGPMKNMLALKGLLGGGEKQAPGAVPQTEESPVEQPGVIAASDTEQFGGAVENRGEDDNPENSSGKGFDEEHGDSPELLKDVDGLGGPKDADPKKQGDALKAFHMNLPLVIEFAESDQPGAEHPLLKALDDLLEEAFPGYKGAEETEHHPDMTSEGTESDSEGHGDEDEGEDSEENSHEHAESKTSAHPDFGHGAQDFGEDLVHGLLQNQQEPQPYLACPNCQHTVSYPKTKALEEQGQPWDRCPKCGEEMYDYAQAMNDEIRDPYEDDQGVGDYERYGPDRQTMQDLYQHESRVPDAHIALSMPMQMVPGMQGQPGLPGQVPNTPAGQTEPQPCLRCGQMHPPGTSCPTDIEPPSGIQPPPAPLAPPGTPNPSGLYSAVEKIAARRPRMCPFHSELVDFSLTLGDASTALGALAQHQFGTSSCKGGWDGHKCGFKAEMVTQPYWDAKEAEAEQRQLERAQQPVGPEQTFPTTFDVPETDLHDDSHLAPETGWTEGSPSAVQTEFTSSEHHEHEHERSEHGNHDWLDDSGQPLQPGQDYELRSVNYAIPDKITVDHVAPDKVVFTVHTDLMDYQDEMTKEDLANEGYSFANSAVNPDSTDGFDPSTNDAPVGDQDGGIGQTDLSDEPTHVSAVKHPERDWIYEGKSDVGVDPQTLANIMGQPTSATSLGSRQPVVRYAGKNFSPTEQREFIDEEGTARNLDKLDLQGTHYETDPDLDDAFLWA